MCAIASGVIPRAPYQLRTTKGTQWCTGMTRRTYSWWVTGAPVRPRRWPPRSRARSAADREAARGAAHPEHQDRRRRPDGGDRRRQSGDVPRPVRGRHGARTGFTGLGRQSADGARLAGAHRGGATRKERGGRAPRVPGRRSLAVLLARRARRGLFKHLLGRRRQARQHHGPLRPPRPPAASRRRRRVVGLEVAGPAGSAGSRPGRASSSPPAGTATTRR